MGTPKQLLPWGDSIVLQRVIDVAAASALARVEVVLGHRADEIAGQIVLPEKAVLLINEAYKEGMHSSVICGVKNAPAGAEGFMLLLGDQPLIEAPVIDRLIAAHRAAGVPGITMPVYNGRRGHPVIFAGPLREELTALGDQGARAVVNRHAAEIREVPLDASQVLTDMDTPEAYRAARAQAEKDLGQESEAPRPERI